MIPSAYWKNWGRYAEQERLDRRYGRETRSVVILAKFPGLCCLCGLPTEKGSVIVKDGPGAGWHHPGCQQSEEQGAGSRLVMAS